MEIELFVSPKIHADKPQDVLTVCAKLHEKVTDFKKRLADELDQPLLKSYYLVWGGSVISDNSLIADSGIEICRKACLIAPSTRLFGAASDNLKLFQDLQYYHDPISEQWDCEPSVDLLEKFISDLSKASTPWKPASNEIGWLKWAIKALSNQIVPLIKSPAVQWYGPYGCALVARLTDLENVHLSLVFLDSWTFHIHTSSSVRIHNSRPDHRQVTALFIGSVFKTEYTKFLEDVKQKFSEVRKRRANDRSSFGGKQGHHKTPGMVQAIMLEVLTSSGNSTVIPRGGFTDVGMHTGGKHRNTAWHLVLSVLHHLLDSKGRKDLFRKVVFQLPLRMAENAITRMVLDCSHGPDSTVQNDSKSYRAFTDSIMETLRHLAQESDAFGGLNTIDESFFLGEARCVRIRHELDKAVERRTNLIAKKYTLPCLIPKHVVCKDLRLTIPPEPQISKEMNTKKSIWMLATENLRFFPIPPPPDDCSWEDMTRWTTKVSSLWESSKSYVMEMIVCNAVESFFFRKMMNLQVAKPALVETILGKYRILARNVQSRDGSHPPLRVELISSEILVVWVSFCLVHHSVKETYELIKDYSVPLQPADLQYLILSKRAAVEAARQVTKYLRNNSRGLGPIFSGLKSDKTLDFALQFGSGDEGILEVWETESRRMEQRKTSRIKEIHDKRERLLKLDQELQTLKTKLVEVRKEIGRLHGQQLSSIYRERGRSLPDRKREEHCLLLEVAATKHQISLEEEAPNPIIQPLPSQRNLAIKVLFFLTISEDLNILSRLSFVAKQMMLPNEHCISFMGISGEKVIENVDTAIATAQPETLWYSYVNQHSTTFRFTAGDEGVVLGSCSKTPSGKFWYASEVRHISSSSDGIWYPDDLDLRLFWKGGKSSLDRRGSGSFFNPFRDTSPLLSMYKIFEPLEERKKDAVINSSQRTRYETKKDTSHGWGEYRHSSQTWSGEQLRNQATFLDFCEMRVCAFQQFRRLCSSLANKTLALTDKKFRVLVQQAIHQLGQFSEDHAVERIRHTDLNTHDGKASLRAILGELCEELHPNSRDHQSIATIGELAAQVSQWDPDCRMLARKLASIAEQAADDLGSDETYSSCNGVSDIRTKRCLLYMSCLLCHSAGALCRDDVRQMCKSLVMAEHTRLFENRIHQDDKIRDLTAATMYAVAARMPEIDSTVSENPEILLNAVKSVLGVHETASENATWPSRTKSETYRSSSVRAISAGGHVYHINLQTGTLLVDGRPPNRLDQSILSSPLYIRSFNDRNFEVVREKDGRAKTTRSIGECFYEFTETDEGVLIKEIDSSHSNSSVQLLDITVSDLWAGDLPDRLRCMYSHWLCRKTNTIFLRPKHFSNRDVHFLMTPSPTSLEAEKYGERSGQLATGTALNWMCFKIPPHSRMVDWRRPNPDLSNLNRLIFFVDRSSQRILEILGKFENLQTSIHCYRTPASSYIIELPRYNLEFELTEKGLWKSNTFSSYFLCQDQNFCDTLTDFFGYLILESDGKKKVLIPAGRVRKKDGITTVKGSNRIYDSQDFHIYAVHPRFGTIEAVPGKLSIEARIQLATLYAATGTLLPEKRIGKTGGEHAIELLRQSWKNTPLSMNEVSHLQSICHFAQTCPALSLLASELLASSKILNFLAFNGETARSVPLDVDASTDYMLQKTRRQLNPRAFLTEEEETVLHGSVVARGKRNLEKNISVIQAFPATSIMQQVKRELSKMLSANKNAETGSELPFDADSFGDTKISEAVLHDLRESWNAYMHFPTYKLRSDNRDELHGQLTFCQFRCRYARVSLERAIHLSLGRIYGHCFESMWVNIRRAANIEPRPTSRDFMKIHCSIVDTDFFNPFLTSEASQRVGIMISEWMECCVMEDKLSRMLNELTCKSTTEVVRELKEVKRKWDVRKHASWLAFEVEQQLQIQDLQHRVAEICLQNPDKITQLTIEAKETQLILPMLILGLLGKTHTIRIHVSSPRLSETYDFLHHTITASLFNRRLYMLPFHRDLQLTPSQAAKILSCVRRCQNNGGAMIIAPEHHLSLISRITELEMLHSIGVNNSCAMDVQKLKRIWDNTSKNFIDIIDENHQILHHKHQLIFPIGPSIPLSSGKERWLATQAVLRQLQCNEEVAEELKVLARRRISPERYGGSMDNIELHSDLTIQQLHRLSQKLALAVSEQTSYGMQWLTRSTFREAAVTFVTERNQSLDEFRRNVGNDITDSQMKYLLALRGILAFGLLHHCLSLRYGVDYGIDTRRPNHRVAVPYRGINQPSERAEYALPDKLIMSTHLAYYYKGMSKEECTEAVRSLLKLSPISQREQEYSRWLQGVESLGDETRRLIDKADDLDVFSDSQMTVFHEVFRYNMAAISFWLGFCVLPKETLQYPQRITANAFHLAENKTGDIIGFSKTAENSILLSLVPQDVSGIQEIKAIEGRVIALMLQNGEIHVLSSVNLSEEILHSCIEKRASTLIDAGALMVGLENDEVAKRMISLVKGTKGYDLKGVLYFDQVEASWAVLSLEGRKCPLGSSPIHERDTFVYIDEGHRQGACSIKKRDDAPVLLTVGPDMCKNKMMKTVDRMTKLDRRQRLVFAVPKGTAEKISEMNVLPLTSKELFRWLVKNTVKVTTRALASWGLQGSLHCAGQDSEATLNYELQDLDGLYGFAAQTQTISDFLERTQDEDTQNAAVIKSHGCREMRKEIAARVREYGSDQKVLRAQVEYEREVEHVREPKCRKDTQVAWDFDEVVKGDGQLRRVLDVTNAVRLASAMKGCLRNLGLRSICWNRCEIYLTRNFLEKDEVGGDLRTVDGMVFFHDGKCCLLVSEWEFEQVLERVWGFCRRDDEEKLKIGIGNFGLMFLGDGARCAEWDMSIPRRSVVGRSITSRASEHTLGGLQLFAGQTKFAGEGRKQAVKELLATRDAKQAALKIVAMRGMGNTIDRSDLEDICSDL